MNLSRRELGGLETESRGEDETEIVIMQHVTLSGKQQSLPSLNRNIALCVCVCKHEHVCVHVMLLYCWYNGGYFTGKKHCYRNNWY